jgi:hypothetical protein
MSPIADLVRFNVPEAMSITKVMLGGFRHGAPTAVAVAGSLEASREKVAIIAYEWPQSFAPVESQADLEYLHIRRFEADLQLHGIPVPYEDLQLGANPPDFWVSLNSKRVGLDLSQIVLTERAAAADIFKKVRSEVAVHSRRDFRHLAGHVVYVTYDSATAGLPPKKRSESDELVSALKRFRPSAGASAHLPSHLPPGTTETFAGGVISARPLTTAPAGAFYGAMGFELAPAFQTTISISEAGDSLRRLVKSHDKPEIHTLVVAAGAPTRAGLAFPSDSLVGRLALEDLARTPFKTEHLARVIVHFWDSRAVVDVDPRTTKFSVLCGDLSLNDE